MEGKKVLKNAGWIIGCKIVQALLTLIVNMLTARYFGPSGYGLINYAASLVAFAVPIMQLGLNSTLVQEIVNDPEKEGEILGTSLVMTFVSSLCTIGGVILFVLIANAGERETLIVCALYSLLLVFQSVEILQYYFQAKLQSKYTSVIMLIAYISVSAYKIVLLILQKSIYWFALAQTLDYFIVAVLLRVAYAKKGRHKLTFSFARIKKLLVKSKYYIVANLMIVFFTQTDRVMLKLMVGDDATGYYAAAATCAGMTSFIFGAIIESLRPFD